MNGAEDSNISMRGDRASREVSLNPQPGRPFLHDRGMRAGMKRDKPAPAT
jgi:hypothetical protein